MLFAKWLLTPQARDRMNRSCRGKWGETPPVLAPQSGFLLPHQMLLALPAVWHFQEQSKVHREQDLELLLQAASGSQFPWLFPENKNRCSGAAKDVKQWPQAWLQHITQCDTCMWCQTDTRPPLLPTQKERRGGRKEGGRDGTEGRKKGGREGRNGGREKEKNKER